MRLRTLAATTIIAAVLAPTAPALASLPGDLEPLPAPTVATDVDRLTALHHQAAERIAEQEAAAAAERAAEEARAARAAALAATAFAEVDGLTLHLPGRQVLTIGFHEARAQHLTLQPQRFQHVVMPSRGREGTPTSAVDVVMPAGSAVLAPVSGTIRKVADFRLYDEHDDVLIEIVPDGRPDLVVTMYHVAGIRVREGQRVQVGETVLADTARSFDFVAQVEAWGRGPHVDLRVHRA